MIDTTMAALSRIPMEQWGPLEAWILRTYLAAACLFFVVVVHGVWSDARERRRRAQRARRL